MVKQRLASVFKAHRYYESNPDHLSLNGNPSRSLSDISALSTRLVRLNLPKGKHAGYLRLLSMLN